MRSASFSSSRARCAGVIDAQGGDSNALRAACTATSMSAAPPAAALREHLCIGRIDDLEGFAGLRRLPAAADEQLAGLAR